MTRDRETARRIAQEVQPLGGSVYYVGGCVRDRLLGRESKDLDIEVHGVTPQQLEIVLDRMGGRRTVGASFGVYGLAGCGLDIAMPRRETTVGRGHRDFTVEVDPWLGPERAARRRDFTVNALMEDVLTGQVLDFFGGREDLCRGLLRHVDDHSFPEDPLRVLRGAQFAARFGFTVAEETVALCRTMDLSALSRERVEGELQKALLQAPRPSIFFRTLDTMHQLHPWFTEVQRLQGVPQPPRYHGEGDVWEHTMAVLDTAAMAAMLAAAEETQIPMLLDLMRTTVFYSDVKTALRAARTRRGGEFLDLALCPVDRLELPELKKAALTGEAELIGYLEQKDLYGSREAMTAYRESPSAFEKWVDDRLMEIARQGRRVTMGPEALIGYLLGKETEIKAVHILASGLRAGQPEEAVRERLRELYG